MQRLTESCFVQMKIIKNYFLMLKGADQCSTVRLNLACPLKNKMVENTFELSMGWDFNKKNIMQAKNEQD